MSALFGRKNYSEIFERLVRSGNIDLALREAIKNGDTLYELGNVDEAILNYNTLLNIFTKNNVSKHEIYEKIYEKLAPLYLDSGNKKKGIEAAFALIDRKIILKKTGEAVKLLKALETSFMVDKDIMLQIVERYVSLGFYREAFEIVDKLIKKESTNTDLLKMGGELLYKLGRFEDSYIYFNAIIMLAPDDEFAKSRLDELKSQEAMHATAEEGPEVISKQVEFNPEEGNQQPTGKSSIPLEMPEMKPEELQKMQSEQPFGKKEGEGQGQEVPKAEKSEKTSSKAPFAPVIGITSENALTVDFRKILHSDPAYLEALENIKNGDEQKGVDILKKVAEKFETANFEVSDYVYNKIIILNPNDIEIKLKLAEVYKDRKDIEDCVFYLRSALKYSKGIEKLEVLRQLTTLLPEDIELKTEIFNSYVELKDFTSAFEIFFTLEDNKTIDNFASRMLPYLKEDIQSLGRVARYIKGKGLSNMVAYQYFYLLGRALFNMGDSVEGTRWLLAASRIAKLPLEDYVMMAQHIKTLPLEGEKEIIGDAILGYLGSVENLDKKESLLRLLLELRPDKVDYLIHYLDTLISTNNIDKETTRAFMRLVKMNPVNYKDFVYDTALKLIDGLSIDELNEIATFFDLLDQKEEATKFYSIIMAKDPNNKIALIKFFITSVEGESLKEIFKFFDQFPPSHIYTSLVDPFVEKYKSRQGKDPFNFHVHFVLGFLYFLTERYEEAIASFQFVARSHQFEAFMHYFLGICFERILLQDFASTQYSMAVNMESTLPEIKLNALYKLGILYKEQGKIGDYRRTLSEIVTINSGFKDAKLLLDALPPEDKLIDFNKEEFK